MGRDFVMCERVHFAVTYVTCVAVVMIANVVTTNLHKTRCRAPQKVSAVARFGALLRHFCWC